MTTSCGNQTVRILSHHPYMASTGLPDDFFLFFMHPPCDSPKSLSDANMFAQRQGQTTHKGTRIWKVDGDIREAPAFMS